MRSLFDAAWRARALDGHADAVTALTDEVLQPLYRFSIFHTVELDDPLSLFPIEYETV